MEQITKFCREISNAEFAQIRQSLAMFFQDKVGPPHFFNVVSCGFFRTGALSLSLPGFLLQRIKVSLFLQDGIQNPDGTIAIPKGGPLVNDLTVEAPGAIRFASLLFCVLFSLFGLQLLLSYCSSGGVLRADLHSLQLKPPVQRQTSASIGDLVGNFTQCSVPNCYCSYGRFTTFLSPQGLFF